MTNGMQSGHDTPLKNLWDEICVQAQDQDSVMWDAYSDTIHSLVLEQVAKLDTATKQAIWLQTDAGIDWSVDNEDHEIPSNSEDIAQYTLDTFVLAAAGNWTNKRIEKYLEKGLE